jgi:hypothetical protein
MLRDEQFRKVITIVDFYAWEVNSDPGVIWVAYSDQAYRQIVHNFSEAADALVGVEKMSREIRCKKPAMTGDFPFKIDGISKSPSIPFAEFEKKSGLKFKWFRSLFIRVREDEGLAYAQIEGENVDFRLSKDIFLREMGKKNTSEGVNITFEADNLRAAASWLGSDW